MRFGDVVVVVSACLFVAGYLFFGGLGCATPEGQVQHARSEFDGVDVYWVESAIGDTPARTSAYVSPAVFVSDTGHRWFALFVRYRSNDDWALLNGLTFKVDGRLVPVSGCSDRGSDVVTATQYTPMVLVEWIYCPVDRALLDELVSAKTVLVRLEGSSRSLDGVLTERNKTTIATFIRTQGTGNEGAAPGAAQSPSTIDGTQAGAERIGAELAGPAPNQERGEVEEPSPTTGPEAGQ